MIYEYALEPELVASWHERIRGRFFIDNFGSGTGRVVSRYPKNWKKQVWDAFDKTFDGTLSEKEKARGRIEELIKQFAIPMTRRSGLPDDGPHWLANAESEHARKPFHAILAHDNPRQNANVMIENDVLDRKAERWDAPGTMIVRRTAEKMAKCVAPMLRCATRILFIDPYFRATEERFRKPLAAFLRNVDTRNSRITVELHTSASYSNAPTWDFFRQECEDKLPSILPEEMTLAVYRWKERDGGEKLHNRYILTDIGGVSFAVGLDEGDPGMTDDVSRLASDPYAKRWEHYAGPNFAFDPDGEVFTVQGRDD